MQIKRSSQPQNGWEPLVYRVHRTLHILDAVLDSITMAYEIASFEVKSSGVAGSISCYPSGVPAVIRAPLTPAGQGSITLAVVQHISWKYYLLDVLTLDFLHSQFHTDVIIMYISVQGLARGCFTIRYRIVPFQVKLLLFFKFY